MRLCRSGCGARRRPGGLRIALRRFVETSEVEGGMIIRKTAAELEKMRRSGLLVWRDPAEAGDDGAAKA